MYDAYEWIAVGVVIVLLCLAAKLWASRARRHRVERDDAQALAEHWHTRWGELRDQLALLPERDPKTGRMKHRERR